MTKYIPYIAAISTLLLAVTIFFLLQQNNKIKGLEESAELVEQYLENQKAENQRLIDSLNNSSQSEIIEAKEKEIDSLLELWNNRPKEPRYDKEVDDITNIDSIAKLFSKYYPNKP